MGRIPTRVRLGVVGLLAVAGFAASCAQPPASAIQTGSISICAPAGEVVRAIQLTPVAAPLGSALHADLLSVVNIVPPEGSLTLNFDVADPEGGTYIPPWVPDPGRCMHVNGTGGLQYIYRVVPETDPQAILAFYASKAHLPSITLGYEI
jgi:hypothetical protein